MKHSKDMPRGVAIEMPDGTLRGGNAGSPTVCADAYIDRSLVNQIRSRREVRRDAY